MLEQVGGFVEPLTTSGDATSLISETMRYRFGGDDAQGKGMVVYDPTDIAADQIRVVTEWDDSAGDATIDGMSDAKAGSETIEWYLRNDPGPFDHNAAINRALRETYRVAEVEIPTADGHREYQLLNAPWIERRRDVQRVLKRNSPNILTNSGFQAWGRGADASLQGWVLSGTASTLTRVAGPYSFAARMVRNGTDARLRQTVPIPITQLYGKSITVFGRIKSATASIASLRISDGTDTTSTTEHDGGDDWDEFTATHTVNADAAGPLTIDCRVIDADGSADFEHVVAVVGTSVPDWLSQYGDQHQRMTAIRATVQMGGPVPTIVLDDGVISQGSQLVIQSRQPYAELTAESGAGGITDIPLEAAVSGAIAKLAETQLNKPNAARWIALDSVHRPKWNAWKRQLSEPSTAPTPNRITITGA